MVLSTLRWQDLSHHKDITDLKQTTTHGCPPWKSSPRLLEAFHPHEASAWARGSSSKYCWRQRSCFPPCIFPPVSNVYNKVGLEKWGGAAHDDTGLPETISLTTVIFNSILWPGIGHKYDKIKINNSNSCSFLISDTRGSRQKFLLCEGFLTRISLQTHTFESMLRPSEWNCVSMKPRIRFHLI